MTSRKKKTVSDQSDEEESESYKRLRKAIKEMYAFNKEEPTVKCIGCEIYFYSEDGMRTHFQHAHTNMKGIGVSAINDIETEATLNDASTRTNAPDTAESELPDIVPPTQTVTRGRKRNRNECDTTVHNKKRSRGSPSAGTKIEQKDSKSSRTEKKPVTKNISEVKLRSKKSEVSDDSTPTSIHFTRSQRTGMQRNYDEMPQEALKQNKRKSNSKDFGTKTIPEKKKKNEVDATEIIQTHTKRNVDENEEGKQKGTAQSSKKSDRKEYATRSKGNVECHDEQQIPIVEESDEMTKDGKKPKSTDMTLEKNNRKNRDSAKTSDDHGKVPTVKSKEFDKPKNKRKKLQTSETSDDSAQLSMSTALEVTETKKQRRTRNTSGNSLNTAQPSTSSGSVPGQSDGRRTTHSKSKKTDNEKSTGNDVQTTENSASAQDGFSCHICQQIFQNYDELKIHKVKCMKNPKKHFCEVCGKGFHARTLMQQHYDFRHTNKPKKFMCTECNKAFELKKSYDEHMMRLHNKGDYKFQCDFCGRRFFHLQEFKVHHARHTNIKEYSCGHCNNAAFATPGKLNAHLATCGKPSTYECTICHKFYSTSSNLAIHVGDVHKNEVTWRCPICPTKVYGSQGGYYHHLRYAHKIGRNGDKLEDYMAKNIPNEKEKSTKKKRKKNEGTNDDTEDNDNEAD